MTIHIITVLGDKHLSAWKMNQKYIETQNIRSNLKFHIGVQKKNEITLARKKKNTKFYELAHIDKKKTKIPDKYFGSYQHGQTLDNILYLVKKQFQHTDYLIIIDPDFYIKGNDWILKFKPNKNEAIVTAWQPRWIKKSDKSLAIHFYYSNHIPTCSLKPKLKRRKAASNIIFLKKMNSYLINFVKIKLPKNVSIFFKILNTRFFRRKSSDTACDLYNHLIKEKIKMKYLNPLIPKHNYIVDNLWCDFNKINVIFEKIIPKGFRLFNIDAKIIDMNENIYNLFIKTKWEFFFFNGSICFHIRGYMNKEGIIQTKSFNKTLVNEVFKKSL